MSKVETQTAFTKAGKTLHDRTVLGQDLQRTSARAPWTGPCNPRRALANRAGLIDRPWSDIGRSIMATKRMSGRVYQRVLALS